jgi:hypothetical protein
LSTTPVQKIGGALPIFYFGILANIDGCTFSLLNYHVKGNYSLEGFKSFRLEVDFLF